MRLPRDVQRYLRAVHLDSAEPETFGTRFPARNISPARRAMADTAPTVRTLATLSAVPRGAYQERIGSLSELAQWLDKPHALTPPGTLIHRDVDLFVTDGVVRAQRGDLIEEGVRGWQSYVLIGRDGYLETGQSAGFVLGDRTYLKFAPLIAWIERCWYLVSELSAFLDDVPRYHLVLHVADSRGTELTTFGDHWLSPTDSEYRWQLGDNVPVCSEDYVQIGRAHDAAVSASDASAWFAERIANAFGFAEPRCFNHPDTTGRRGPPGALPADRLEFR